MKQLSLILLLCFFLFDAIGVYFFYESGIRAARSEAASIIRSVSRRDELVSISIDKSEYRNLEWITDNEFRYHDKIYDVVASSTCGEEIVYTCYHDEKEHRAIAGLSNHISTKTDNTAPGHSSKPVLKEFDKYFSMKDALFVYTPGILMIIHREIFFEINLFPSNIPTPPPNIG